MPGMTGTGSDWRVVDGVRTAWFDASSLVEGAGLAGRIMELSGEILVDARVSGVRPGEEGDLVDPLRRDPDLRIRQSTELRPLRHRVHLDVVRPAAAVDQASLGDGRGPYGVCHADPDGNDVDLVPGDVISEKIGTGDWAAVFSAMACYRTTSPGQQRDLTAAAAELADRSGFALLVDLRPGLVIVDSGKDQWEDDVHGLDIDFTELAAELQATARGLGATADPGLPRFVQLFLDAADVAAVRAFWIAALGYTADQRAGVTDIHDPRRLNPVLVFQESKRRRSSGASSATASSSSSPCRRTSCRRASPRPSRRAADSRGVGRSLAPR